MTGIDHGFRRQRRELLARCSKVRRIRKWQIGSADRARKEAVAHERDAVAVDDDVSGSVSRGMHHAHLLLPDFDVLSIGELAVRWRRFFEWEPVDFSLSRSCLVQSAVERMQVDRHIPFAFYGRNCADVIDVSVRHPDRLKSGAARLNRIDESLAFAARVNYHGGI